MPHTVSYNPGLNLIEVEIRGSYTLADAKELLTTTVELVNRHECFSILCDLREAKIGLSTLEIHEAPATLGSTIAASGIEIHKLRRALIVDQTNPDARFLETVARNSGHQVTIFQNFDDAKRWLLK